MNGSIRRKLDSGERAHAFSLAHPSDDPGHSSLVTRLGERLVRARSLAAQEITGRKTVQASVRAKAEIRRQIRQQLLILSGTARLVALDERGVEALFKLPRVRESHQAFLAFARTALAQATERKAQLMAYGLPVTFLEDCTALVRRYEAAVGERQAGGGAHVGANAALVAVTKEVMRIIQLIDRINAVRFRRNAELLAAWKSARTVVHRRGSGRAEDPTLEQALPDA
jgi:hypothetical protein